MNGSSNEHRLAGAQALHRLFLGAVLVSCGIPGAHAETWLPFVQEWVGNPGEHLGATMAVDGDASGVRFVYVGAPDAAFGAIAGAGIVYVFVPSANGLAPAGILAAGVPQAGAHFGASLSARSGNIVVGAPDYNDSSGAGAGAGAGYVEFFFNNGVNPIVSRGHKIGSGGNFGSAVAVTADFAAASSVNAGNGDGCVFTFQYDLPSSHWINFPANDVKCGSGGEKLGASLDMLETGPGTFLVVAGAPAATQGANALAGAAHVYFPNNDSLIEVGTLAAQSPAFLDVFGASVGIDGNYVYVGATGRDNGAGRSGSVTIFKPGFIIGYDYVTEVFPQAPATIGGHCGASLGVDPIQSGFVFGCPDSDGLLAGEGNARLLRPFDFLGTTVWLESLLSYGTQTHSGGDALGTSVALYGDRAFAGAANTHVSGQSGNGGVRRSSRTGFSRTDSAADGKPYASVPAAQRCNRNNSSTSAIAIACRPTRVNIMRSLFWSPASVPAPIDTSPPNRLPTVAISMTTMNATTRDDMANLLG